MSKFALLFLIIIAFSNAEAQDLTKDLQGWWCLTDISGSAAPDKSLNSLDGKVFGKIEVVSDGDTLAASFNGNDCYIEIPASDALDSRNFTISGWFKSVGGNGKDGHSNILTRLWRDKNQSSKYDVLSIILNRKSPVVEFYYNFDGAESNPEPEYFPANANIQPNSWQFIAITKQDKELIIYMNGAPMSVITLNTDNDPYANPANWIIGSQIDEGRIWGPFKGLIRDIRIYSRALTANEVELLHMLGKGNLAVASAKKLDFGFLYCANDTTLTISLNNNSNYPIDLDGINFKSGKGFKASNPNLEPMAPLESRMFNLTFDPDRTGWFWDTLLITSPWSCLPLAEIPVIAADADIAFEIEGAEKDTIDFGTFCPNNSEKMEFHLKNKSSVKTSFSISQPNYPFSLITQNYKVTLDTHQTAGIVVICDAPTQKEYFDSLTVTDTCGNFKKIYLKATVSQMVKVWIPDTTAAIGSRICIPVYIKSECRDTTIYTINFAIMMPGDALLPEDTDNILRDKDSILFRFNSVSISLTGDRQILGYICGTVMLSDKIKNPIEFRLFDSDKILTEAISLQNGSLEIDGCALPLSRVKLYKPTQMSVFTKINGSSSIKVISGETGLFQLFIYDNVGGIVASKSWTSSTGNGTIEKVFNFDDINLHSGIYFIVLQTPMLFLSEKLPIIK